MADYYTRQLQQRNAILQAQRFAAAQAQAQQMAAARQQALQQRDQAIGIQQQRLGQLAGRDQWEAQMRAAELQNRMDREARAEADRVAQRERQALNDRRGALRPGHRWKPDNPMEQELIPGGPEWRKAQQQHAQDLSSLEAINDQTQGIIGRMGSIEANKKGFEANFGLFPEAITRYIPGDRYNTKVNLEQLESMAKTSGLSDIRSSSGQSIGAITEREWPIIADQLLKLNVGQTDEGAREMLGTARRKLLNVRNRELREYQNRWKDSPFYKEQPFQFPPVETEGKRAGIPKTFAYGQEVWDHLTPEEKALWVPGLK